MSQQSSQEYQLLWIDFILATGSFLHNVQLERGMTAAYVSGRGRNDEVATLEDLQARYKSADLAYLRLREVDTAVNDIRPSVTPSPSMGDLQLEGRRSFSSNPGDNILQKTEEDLNALRTQALRFSKDWWSIVKSYNRICEEILSLATSAYDQMNVPKKALEATATYLTFMRVKEAIGMERGLVSGILGDHEDSSPNTLVNDLILIKGMQRVYEDAFRSMAPPKIWQLLSRGLIHDTELMRVRAVVSDTMRISAIREATTLRGWWDLITRLMNNQSAVVEASLTSAMKNFAVPHSPTSRDNSIHSQLQPAKSVLSLTEAAWPGVPGDKPPGNPDEALRTLHQCAVIQLTEYILTDPKLMEGTPNWSSSRVMDQVADHLSKMSGNYIFNYHHDQILRHIRLLRVLGAGRSAGDEATTSRPDGIEILGEKIGIDFSALTPPASNLESKDDDSAEAAVVGFSLNVAVMSQLDDIIFSITTIVHELEGHVRSLDVIPSYVYTSSESFNSSRASTPKSSPSSFEDSFLQQGGDAPEVTPMYAHEAKLLCIHAVGEFQMAAKDLKALLVKRFRELFRTAQCTLPIFPTPASLLPTNENKEAVTPTEVESWAVDIHELHMTEKLATGSQGSTYLATWNGLDVCAKVFMSTAEKGLQDFKQELATMMRLRHPNIVLFLGSSIATPTYILVMEYLDNGTLYNALRSPCVAPGFFFNVAVGVARGMAYLHHRKIIHRDLKSPNVLLDSNGAVKITDFGLSVFSDDHSKVELTGETGTYRWMAPEIVRHQPYGAPADVYSYGIILWELLTHRMPWYDITPVQAAVAVAVEHRRPLLPPATPPPIAHLVEACWADNPTDRPNFDEILNHLEEMQNPGSSNPLTATHYKFLEMFSSASGKDPTHHEEIQRTRSDLPSGETAKDGRKSHTKFLHKIFGNAK